MPRPSLSIAKDGPVDHVAAALDHHAQAVEHAKTAEMEGRVALANGAEHYARLAKLPTLHPGVAEEYRQVAEAMQQAAQRIAAISSKGNAA